MQSGQNQKHRTVQHCGSAVTKVENERTCQGRTISRPLCLTLARHPLNEPDWTTPNAIKNKGNSHIKMLDICSLTSGGIVVPFWARPGWIWRRNDGRTMLVSSVRATLQKYQLIRMFPTVLCVCVCFCCKAYKNTLPKTDGAHREDKVCLYPCVVHMRE